MDDSYFAELDAADLERIEEGNLEIENERKPPESDEAVEAKESRKVKPKIPKVSNRPKLDDKRLKGERGLIVLEPLMKELKLKGKGHEVKDLNTVMSALEHWAHRLFTKMTFDDCIEKIEELGHKKSISSYVALLRMDAADQFTTLSNDHVMNFDEIPNSDGDQQNNKETSEDPFDRLVREHQQRSELTEEQRARMEKNRMLAEQRRLDRMKQRYEVENSNPVTAETTEQLFTSNVIEVDE